MIHRFTILCKVFQCWWFTSPFELHWVQRILIGRLLECWILIIHSRLHQMPLQNALQCAIELSSGNHLISKSFAHPLWIWWHHPIWSWWKQNMWPHAQIKTTALLAVDGSGSAFSPPFRLHRTNALCIFFMCSSAMVSLPFAFSAQNRGFEEN